MTMINICGICCILILFDIVCGIIAAAKEKNISSSIMRNGLYHKVSELILLGLAAFLNYILYQPPFDTIGIPPEILYTVSVYIAVMEILSILENTCKINPNLPLAQMLKFFNISIDKTSNDDIINMASKE